MIHDAVVLGGDYSAIQQHSADSLYNIRQHKHTNSTR